MACGRESSVIENCRAGEAAEGEHFDAAVEGTAHARTREGVGPSAVRVAENFLQGIGGKTTCHDNDWHPDGEVSLRGEVDPKSVFNNSVGEGVKDFADLGGLVASAGDGAVNGIENKDKSKGCGEVEVKFSVSAEQGKHNKG